MLLAEAAEDKRDEIMCVQMAALAVRSVKN